MNIKKIIALVLVIALCCTISIGLTVAYLTDRDSKANVFTVGDIDIELKEDFEDESTLIPGLEINKDVWVNNIGENDAWVWYTYAVPTKLESVVELTFAENANWIAPFKAGTYNENGVDYTVYACLWNAKVAPNAGTGIGLDSVKLSEKVDIDPDGNWHVVEGGVATDLEWANSNGNPVIYVNAYGIQTEGFANVSEAYNAYRNQWATGLNEAPKIANNTDDLEDALENGEDVVLPPSEDPIEKPADITAPYGNKAGYIQKGGVFDGGNNTLVVTGGGDNYGILTYGGTIKNVTIADVFRGIVTYQPTEDVILDNVHIKDNVGYAFNTAELSTTAGVELIVSNSSFGGWSSFEGGFESASFTDCDFVKGSYYNNWPYDTLVKPYIDTVFTNCTFVEDYYLDLSSLEAGATVTLTNCSVNGTVITAENCTTLFGEVELPGDGRTLADCLIFN